MNISPATLAPPPVESMARPAGWATALRGIFAVVFGLIAMRSPHLAAGALVIVFAVYAFADGALDLMLAARLGRAGRKWGWYLFEGLASIALGVIALAYPGATLVALVFLVGLRAIVLGVLELVAAFSWEGLESRWLLGLAGVLSIVLGIILLGSPVAGAMALVWTIGIYAIVFGVAVFAMGLHILGIERHERHERHEREDRERAMGGPAPTVS